MKVIKRSGKEVEYDGSKVMNAVTKTFEEVINLKDRENIDDDVETVDYASIAITENNVYEEISNRGTMTIEEIGDFIQRDLLSRGHVDEGIAFVTHRTRKQRERENSIPVDYKYLTKEFLSNYKHAKNPMTEIGEFVYYRTYSRWLNEKGRREYWWETVARAVDYNCSLEHSSRKEAEKLYDNVFNLRQFLSGRTFWVGGTEVAKKYPMANFNCAFTVIDEFKAFKDLFYLLMVGSGVGVRVLKDDVSALPKIRTKTLLINSEYDPIEKSKRVDNTGVEFPRLGMAKVTVGDSKNGWVQAMDYYLKLLYSNDYRDIDTIVMNYDNIRPKGELLKTFGGTASGYESLKNMFVKITKIINDRGMITGEDSVRLLSIDCLDIANIIGENVVVGGVRRTAEIALLDSEDNDSIEAKTLLYKEVEGEWIVDESIIHRQMSNNSIYYKEKPSREQLHWQIEQMRYSGEPAWVNEEAGTKRRDNMKGVNPSMPQDVLVQTTDGIFNINELEGKNFFVKSLNGEIAEAECWLSSPNAKVYDIDFKGGRHTFATAKHKFPIIENGIAVRKAVSEIKKGDKIPLNRNELQGFSKNLTYEDGLVAGIFIGDGSITQRSDDGRFVASLTVGDLDPEIKAFIDDFYTKKTGAILKWNRRNSSSNSQETNFGKQTFVKDYLIDTLGVPLSRNGKSLPSTIWTNGDDFATGIVNGLFSTDGNIDTYGENDMDVSINLTGSQHSLTKDLQKLLSFYGISSDVNIRNVKPKFPNGKTYDRDYEISRIRIRGSQVLRFNKIFNIMVNRKQERVTNSIPNLKDRNYIIVDSVTYRSNEAVWDISVNHNQHVFPSQHCYTGNCGEILLDNNGLCNLTTINAFSFVKEDGTLDKSGLLEAQKLSVRAGYRMTCVELELPRWNFKQQRDKLLGCSLTGWQDMVNALGYSREDQKKLLVDLREIARNTANEYADAVGQNRPILITTVKPEGTLSQLPTVSSGVHYSHSPYYIRRVRINANDPLVKVCEELDYPIHPEVGQNWETCSTKVIEFPVKAPEGITKYDVSAIEQLENYKLFMEYYVDHNCSITVHVRNDEWDAVEEWVWEHWDDVVALSFLSLDDSFYQLLPYEAITEEEYNKREKAMKSFVPDLLQKYEKKEVELDLGSEKCSTGACPVR